MPEGELRDWGATVAVGGTSSAGVASPWSLTVAQSMTDRPLTSITDDQKGHSRPILQPSTFAKPYSGGGTIPEEKEVKMSPEVPRRIVSDDRSQMTGKTPAAMKTGQKIGQKMDCSSDSDSVPDFYCRKLEMGKFRHSKTSI